MVRLGLMEIVDASEPDKPQWLAALTRAGQLRAQRFMRVQYVDGWQR